MTKGSAPLLGQFSPEDHQVWFADIISDLDFRGSATEKTFVKFRQALMSEDSAQRHSYSAPALLSFAFSVRFRFAPPSHRVVVLLNISMRGQPLRKIPGASRATESMTSKSLQGALRNVAFQRQTTLIGNSIRSAALESSCTLL